MNQRNEERTDVDRLRARARALFISQATIDDLLAWATPRQLQAVDRLLRTELDNRETSKRARLLRRARFPVPKTLDGYDFTNVKLPDGYARDELLSLDFVGRAQDLVFYGKTGRGKTHLATALGMSAVDRGMNVRFLPTAELVLQLGRAKREGTLETMLKDIAKADLIILDEFGYVPFDVDGARLLYQVIAGSYERRSIILRHEHRVQQMGHDLRRRQTRRLDHRPHRSPRTTHRIHRTKPPHQPGTHVRQTPKPIKHTRPARPSPKPKKIPDEKGVVTFCWTPVSLFFDYATSPSSRLRFAMLVPKASLIRSSRYQRMYPSNCSTNPSMVTPVKLRPWKNSCLRCPKNPSAAALSRLQPFALIDRVNPFSLQMLIHPGHR